MHIYCNIINMHSYYPENDYVQFYINVLLYMYNYEIKMYDYV